jgi:uncharacterized membrane protein
LGLALSAPAQAQPAPPPKAPGGGGGPGGGAPGGGGGPGAPGGGSPKFTLSVCNKSNVKNVWMAFASLKDPQTWHVHGWYQVPDTGCAKLGEFYRDTIYYFAIDGALQTVWQGDKTQQCVNPAKQFDYVQAGASGGEAHQCSADEAIVGFDVITVKPTGNTFTLTLQ